MRALVPVVVALALAGCGAGDGSSFYGPPSIAPEHVQSVDIDSGEKLDQKPGEGVGFFVEYTRGTDTDAWHLFGTCDTTTSNYLCEYDVVASVDEKDTLTVSDDKELEKPDRTLPVDAGATRIVMETGEDVDGVTLETPAGATLRVDLLWDSGYAPDILHWIGGGSLHTGAPSDPVDFVPASP